MFFWKAEEVQDCIFQLSISAPYENDPINEIQYKISTAAESCTRKAEKKKLEMLKTADPKKDRVIIL